MAKKDLEGMMRASLARERAVLRACHAVDVAATAKRVRDDSKFLDMLSKPPGELTAAEQEYVLHVLIAFHLAARGRKL